jgi:hypothetical protein
MRLLKPIPTDQERYTRYAAWCQMLGATPRSYEVWAWRRRSHRSAIRLCDGCISGKHHSAFAKDGCYCICQEPAKLYPHPLRPELQATVQ